MNLQLKIDQLANCRQSGIFDHEPDGIGTEKSACRSGNQALTRCASGAICEPGAVTPELPVTRRPIIARLWLFCRTAYLSCCGTHHSGMIFWMRSFRTIGPHWGWNSAAMF